MPADIVLRIDGESLMKGLDPELFKVNLARAVNAATKKARTESARRVLTELNVPPSYLQPSRKRLWIPFKATRHRPTSAIAARSAPTMLSRFAVNRPRGKFSRKLTPKVAVKPGAVKYMPGAFFIKLAYGNLGIGIRLKPGQRLRNKRVMAAKRKGGLYILYGPSIQQAFIGEAGTGIAAQISDELPRMIEEELVRLNKVFGGRGR